MTYGQVGWFDFVYYDDPAYVTENGHVNGGITQEGLKWAASYAHGAKELKHLGVENLWHPLTWISHMVDVEIFGAKWAGGHHFMNLFWHGVASLFAFLFFRRTLDSVWAGFFVALFFAIHPLKAESVAWVSERKDVLSGAFFWAALWCAFRETRNCGSSKRHRSWRWLSFPLYGLALLSKPSVVVFPVLCILVDGWLGNEKKWGKLFWIKGIKRWWAWFVLGGVVAAVTVMLQVRGSHADFMEGSLVGRLTMIAPGLLFYLWRLIWPGNLSFHYSAPEFAGLSGQLLLGLSWVVVVGATIWLWRNRERYRGLFVASCWFVICWLPMSGAVYVGTSFTADRYLYLASAGPMAGLVIWLMKWSAGKKILAFVGMAWAILCWIQVSHWQDSRRLFEHAIKAQPNDQVAWTNLGSLHQLDREWEKAIACHDRALEIGGGDYLTWYNRGFCFQNMCGKGSEAKKSYQESLKNYADYLPSLKNLGMLYAEEKSYAEAGRIFLKASEITHDRDQFLLISSLKMLLAQSKWGAAEEVLRKLESGRLQLNSNIEKEVQGARAYLEKKNIG